MAPNGATVTALLKQTVFYHLDNFTYDNALFFAERLQAQDPRSGESAYIVALCHLRLGDHQSAYEVSKSAGYRGIHLGCAFVFAQACLQLDRYKDGITALEKSRGLWANKSNLGKHSNGARAPYADTAAVCCLLGKLYRGYDDKKKAISNFEEALKSNPFMWDAFTSLCDMGVSVRVPNIFKANETLLKNFDLESSSTAADQKESVATNPLEPIHKKSALQSVVQDVNDPFGIPRSSSHQDAPSNSIIFSESGENDFMSKIAAARSRLAASTGNVNGADGTETPLGHASTGDVPAPRATYPSEPPQAPARRARGATDQSMIDPPPRMSYRVGSKKREKTQDQPTELLADSTSSIFRGSSLSIAAADRKRTVSGHPAHPGQTRQNPGEEPRRSARLNVFPKSNVPKPNSGAATIGATASRDLKKARPPISRIMRPGSSGSSVGRVVSGNRKPLEENNGMDIDQAELPRIREAREAPAQAPVHPQKSLEPETIKVEEALRWILDLLKRLGSGYLLAAQFQCQEALSTFDSVPRSHRDTPWVLAQMGKAQFEQANYAEAEKYFRRVRILAPTRLEDMEVYSTILWHLKSETDLSFLAHELVDSAWHSPQAWCTLGNTWSLARDPEQALKCFKRATQLDPKFAYAYTLQGHEHVLNEEYDKALLAYRQAISADRRHYNAYYGIGKVYEKLGNYDKAFSHYSIASSIHPTNAVLICCIGTVLEKQKQTVHALQYFCKATELAPKAALTRFKKARALLAMGQLEAAQRELMVLKDLAPDDARVHFLLGKLCKTLRDKKSAVRHFTIALSLDPKASQEIKAAIESLEEDDHLDDSMMQ
ncbi:TPR-like protein [Coniochaeta sp. PMI_546]|nr:TPR-like protein [Coniochaeta sp. PMI_546]